MLRELIHDKINEVFAEYQRTHSITNGDIHPEDALELDTIEDKLAELIKRVCTYQFEKRYDDFIPSWYIYADWDGDFHTVAFGQITEDQFFTKVSYKICYDDLDDSTMLKIYYKGKEAFYAGWQPCMKYEYTDADGNSIWVGYFEEWDH